MRHGARDGRGKGRTAQRPPASRPAPGPSHRQLRAGELLRHALIETLAAAPFRDPDLVGASITVSEVRASPDLKHATAFVMPLGGHDAARTIAALKRARAFIRTEVQRRVQLRHAPEFHFELDRSYDEAARIEGLLRAAKARGDVEG